jgi:NTE family protein
MEDDLLTLLRSSKIFSSLNKRTINRLLPRFEKTELDKDEILYQQGDPSDSIDIVLTGNLTILFTTATGESKVVGMMGPGETIGELGALSGEPRATTVKATQHTILFKLPSDDFVELCHRYPAILFSLISPIVSRSQQIIQTLASEKFKRHIVIIPANRDVVLKDFAPKLEEHVTDLNSLILLSDQTENLLTSDHIQTIIEKHKTKNIKKIKQKFIYLLSSRDTDLSHYSLPKAEMIYVIANGNSPVVLDDHVKEKLEIFKSTQLKPELILLHDENTKLPQNTIKWLKLANFGLHHHIRIDRSSDFNRLIRFIRNKPVGVVLGGGGTRGWGHAGAIKAITEAGIPIDIAGGASVGAIVAASYALTLSDEETLEQFREVIEGSRYSVSWRNLTWPAISLFNAKGLTHILQTLFGDIQIEDLWLPYFCVSTNMADNTETIHREGSLWEQVRASISIPGVIPPMVLNGKLHFDGGLLNNLPVDIMRNLIGMRGNIVAVELTISNVDSRCYNFPPVLPFWHTLLSKLKIVSDYKFPPFIDTFLKSLLVGSFAKAQQNSLAANLLVSLDLSSFPMLHSNRKLENRIVDIGYESTMLQIKNMLVMKSKSSREHVTQTVSN